MTEEGGGTAVRVVNPATFLQLQSMVDVLHHQHMTKSLRIALFLALSAIFDIGMNELPI